MTRRWWQHAIWCVSGQTSFWVGYLTPSSNWESSWLVGVTCPASQWPLLSSCRATSRLALMASKLDMVDNTCLRLSWKSIQALIIYLITLWCRLALNGRNKLSTDEQALVCQKRKQTQQHLQRKIQQRQQHKQQQQHQLNLLLHPSTSTGKQFTPILPQTEKVGLNKISAQ